MNVILKTDRLIFCLSLLWLTMTASHGQPAYETQLRSFARLHQTYASQEYSAINRQLAFPTTEPNLQQRTDETKATKLQIQALNSWQREFDIRLQKIIDTQRKLGSSNALVYQNFAGKVSATYERLKRKELNFGTANQALLAAQASLVLDPEIAPKSVQTIPSTVSPPTTQPAQPKPSPKPAAELVKKSTQANKANTASNIVCDQKLVELEALRLEEENWDSVTASLNQVIKEPSDRETAEHAQGVQSRERQIKIIELTSFRTKNCKQ